MKSKKSNAKTLSAKQMKKVQGRGLGEARTTAIGGASAKIDVQSPLSPTSTR